MNRGLNGSFLALCVPNNGVGHSEFEIYEHRGNVMVKSYTFLKLYLYFVASILGPSSSISCSKIQQPLNKSEG